MTDKEIAEEYLNQAKNLLSPRGFFSRIRGPKSKKAMKIYQKAGTHFKAANLWTDAALAYIAAAKIYENDMFEKLSTAGNFADAGDCYSKVSSDDAIMAYTKAIDIWIKMGEHLLAAKKLKECCKICKNDLNDEKRAKEFYAKAHKVYPHFLH